MSKPKKPAKPTLASQAAIIKRQTTALREVYKDWPEVSLHTFKLVSAAIGEKADA